MDNHCTFQTTHVGSKKECLAMLDLALKKGIHPMVETVEISKEGCKEVVTRVQKSDVRYRFTLVGYDKVFGSGDESLTA
jgi:alcohol dehydrogenase (NADP+)